MSDAPELRSPEVAPMVIEPDPVKVATVADYPRGHAQIADVKALRHPHADVQEK